MAIPEVIETFMLRLGFDYATLPHAPAFTAPEEAEAAHVPGRDWAKTVVYFAADEPILAVVPADHTVDADRLRTVAGVGRLRLATEAEMRRLYPESETGAMPPLGPLYGQGVFVDQHIADDEQIVFNAGTHTDAIRIRYLDFAELVHPTVGHFAVLPPKWKRPR